MMIQAFIRAGGDQDLINGVVAWLLNRKDNFGNWQSTQATILTLRALNELAKGGGSVANGTINVTVNDVLVETFEVTPENSDLLRQVSINEYLAPGNNQIELALDGTGSLLYQIAGQYYLPWPEPDNGEAAIDLSVTCSDTELSVGDVTVLSARMSNRTGERQDMLMAELGLPPGFEPSLADLAAYVDNPQVPVSRVERRGRSVVVYLYGLDPGENLLLEMQLQATMPMEVKAPPSSAWLYYQPDVKTESQPYSLIVTEG